MQDGVTLGRLHGLEIYWSAQNLVLKCMPTVFLYYISWEQMYPIKVLPLVFTNQTVGYF